MTSYRVLGRPAPRNDGAEKVTGRARYTADTLLPSTLWGKALRSPYPHARILRVETARALALPGVRAVLTGADVRGVLSGRRLRDVPVLAYDRVRFAGERVAGVAADDPETAQRAVDLIEVEYEELPAVFDPEAALQEGAPLLHPDVQSYAGLPRPLEDPSNAFVRDLWETGDIASGFAQADLIVESTFTTPRMHQGYMEPHSCLVWADESGRVEIWAPNKAPHRLKHNLVDALGLQEKDICVNYSAIGGDFGGKGSPMDVPLCYFLSLRTGRPVRMAMSCAEELTAGNPRHASTIRMRTGVKRDGTLVAHDARIYFNSGAYGGFKPVPGVNLPGAEHAGGPYRIPHARIEALQVYTNTIPGGFFRGPGAVQTLFALESQMDIIARKLGMDPVDFRLRNLLQERERTAAGHVLPMMQSRETVEAALRAAGYGKPKPQGVGPGVAFGYKDQGEGQSSAAVVLHPNGSVVLHTSVYEQGTGSYTAFRQIVAEELGLPPVDVPVEPWTTDEAPFDTGIGASRVTRVAGPAVYEAALLVKQELARLAAELLGWPEERLAMEGRDIVRTDTGERESWQALVTRMGAPVASEFTNRVAEESSVASFLVQIAEVSVDRETGQVKLLRVTSAHDVGTVLDPIGHQGQINGGAVQGIGQAVMEDLAVVDGRVQTANLGDYKLPTIADVPDLMTVLVQSADGAGPYHTKGIGEYAIEGLPAAIANAVEDAAGVRIKDLPITAERVYWALHGR